MGARVGEELGCFVGESVGACEGATVGDLVGERLGLIVGAKVGLVVGAALGAGVGEVVGAGVGAGVYPNAEHPYGKTQPLQSPFSWMKVLQQESRAFGHTLHTVRSGLQLSVIVGATVGGVGAGDGA